MESASALKCRMLDGLVVLIPNILGEYKFHSKPDKHGHVINEHTS